MALSGTLEDFGIAEILQLIAQQTKSGMLRLRNRSEEVLVWFDAGNVVRVEQTAGNEMHLLGHRLVRAGIITERELEDALEVQRRTLERLGDVLIARNSVSPEDLREMAHLQATETLYRLFTWKSGTYEFEAGPVAGDPRGFPPIRGEAILMEGFRILDEWPLVRKKIGSPLMTFERLRELPPPRDDDRRGGLDPNEWRVLALVQRGRTVERLVELSRLGEFETYKALAQLVSSGYLRAIPPEDGRNQGAAAGQVRALGIRLWHQLRRAAVTGALILLFAAMVYQVSTARAAARGPGLLLDDRPVQRQLARVQQARIEAALEVFRLESGQPPADLEELVGAGLLAERDLHHPWEQIWHYRPLPDGGWILLPPFR